MTLSLSRLALIAGLATIVLVVKAGAASLFEKDAVLEVELTGPIKTLFAREPDEAELPFTLRADGIDHRVEVSLRGKSRLRLCEFPPLRLNFNSKSVAGTEFEDQDKLKLVTHCRSNERYEQDMLLEYAAYRIFNLLSEISYRVRLLRLTYRDTDDGLVVGNRYGFLVESTGHLAGRVGATALDRVAVRRNSLNPEQAALVYVFQYLVGNTDWSLVTADGEEFCCHNIDLFAIDAEPYLVPYDFDLSGLVNARYAKPDPSLRISRVTQRLYRGYCIRPEALKSALRVIDGKRSAIVGVPAGIPGVSPKETAVATRYLERFFDRAGGKRKIVEHFQSRCL